MTNFATWLVGLIKALFDAIWNFLEDVAISILSGILTALAAVIGSIDMPEFATAGMTPLLASIPPDVWFFAGHFNLGECFSVLGAGLTFRLARKAMTLFQW